MKNNSPVWAMALAACAPLFATAQDAKTEPPSAAPALVYRSAFADYKPYKDAPLANWRELNATVAGAPSGSSGHAGHAGHGMGGMKRMEAPSPPAAPASGAIQKSAPMHDGHHMKGGKP